MPRAATMSPPKSTSTTEALAPDAVETAGADPGIENTLSTLTGSTEPPGEPALAETAAECRSGLQIVRDYVAALPEIDEWTVAIACKFLDFQPLFRACAGAHGEGGCLKLAAAMVESGPERNYQLILRAATAAVPRARGLGLCILPKGHADTLPANVVVQIFASEARARRQANQPPPPVPPAPENPPAVQNLIGPTDWQ